MKKIFSIVICCFLMINFVAVACAANIGTATTSVYVRDKDTGEIKGSLEKNDKVVVDSVGSNGWAKVSIGETEYKVWAAYLNIEEGNLDEVKLTEKPRKSKSAETDKKNGIKNKKTAKLDKDSDLYGIGSLFWG